MSTHPRRRKRQQHICSQDPSPHKQLRLLAPKVKARLRHSVSPVQHRLQLEHHNIRDEQNTEPPTAATVNVKLEYPETSQSYIPSVSSDFTSPPLLFPDSTVSSFERKQDAVVAPCTNGYFNRVLLAPADGNLPELTCGNLLSGDQVATDESHGLPSQHPSYNNLQLQETMQNQQDQDYWASTLDTPEVWTIMTQPTIGVHQSQCSICFLNQYDFTQGGNECMLISI